MLWRSVWVNSAEQVVAALAQDRGASSQTQAEDGVELRIDHADKAMLRELAQAWDTVDVLLTTHETDRNHATTMLRWGADLFQQRGVRVLIDLPYCDRKLAGFGDIKATGATIVGSHHDFEATPDRDTLQTIIDGIFAAGADIAKVACLAASPQDAARLIGLLDDERPIIAIGMGTGGTLTRLAGALYSPIAFVPAGKETGPGQLSAERLTALMNLVQDNS